MNRGARKGCAILAILAVVSWPAGAVESLQARIAAISGDDWRISGFEFDLDLSDASLRGSARIARLELPSAGLSFADTRVDCGRIVLSGTVTSCLDARLDVELPGTGRVRFPGEAHYEREGGVTRFAFHDVLVAGGTVTMRGNVSEDAVDLQYSGDGLHLESLAALAAQFVQDAPPVAATGSASVIGTLEMRGGGVTSASVKAELQDVSLSNEAGTVVTDAMHARLDLSAANAGGRWQFAVASSADAGEAYVEPVYTDLGQGSVTFNAEGHAAADFADVALTRFAVTRGSEIDVSGDLRIAMGEEQDATLFSGSVELEDSSVDAIYSGLLQVFLAGTVAGDLQTGGTIAGTLEFDDNELSGLQLELHDFIAHDDRNRFSVEGLNGIIRWAGPASDIATAGPSHLSWDSASAWSIRLGQSGIEARVGGGGIELASPARIPTMGGAIVVNRLRLDNLGTEDAGALLDAELEPIELGQLTGAFGWPAFSGFLSGRLPLLQYEGGVVTLGGSLSAKAFDGDIEFANLRLEEPFGLVPRLYGNLTLRQLDLEQLTDTFSFGLIQGRLSGDVTGLELVGWEPVAMDLHLYTPPGDRSRRRISQRAVENLASVGGGGAAAALSSGFMKFFEEFSYDRIGIRCILEDGTCRMSGAGIAGESEFGQGYYIVKGSGLPRIDVVGYRHQVSWSALVKQLDNITKSGGPVVN